MGELGGVHIGYILAISYLLLLNGNAFVLFGIDKLKARKGRWRIPERSLLVVALLGGSIGAWLGIKVWHHKTLHKKFSIGVPLIICLQIGLLVGAYLYLL
ncbi:MAG: DUF1294 domain-containing protein [Parabacteroides sp.]